MLLSVFNIKSVLADLNAVGIILATPLSLLECNCSAAQTAASKMTINMNQRLWTVSHYNIHSFDAGLLY